MTVEFGGGLARVADSLSLVKYGRGRTVGLAPPCKAVSCRTYASDTDLMVDYYCKLL